VARARTEVCRAMAPDLPAGQIETLRLLISELVTNAVRHGDGSESVQVHAYWDSEIRIEVCDHGDGFTPTPCLGRRDEPGGFGLFLVGQLADRWGVETTDGTTVWFVLGTN
jgi:serine/threonine-protein kinase RsbW